MIEKKKYSDESLTKKRNIVMSHSLYPKKSRLVLVIKIKKIIKK